MSSTVDRIKQFVDMKGISVRKFEEKVGFSNGSFASQYKNNKTIGVDKVENILHFYPEINTEWLLTGNGGMLKTKSEENTNKINVSKNVSQFVRNPNVQKKLTFEKETNPVELVAEGRSEYGKPQVDTARVQELQELLREQKELYTGQIQFLTAQIDILTKSKDEIIFELKERIEDNKERIEELKEQVSVLKNVSSLDDTQRGVG